MILPQPLVLCLQGKVPSQNITCTKSACSITKLPQPSTTCNLKIVPAHYFMIFLVLVLLIYEHLLRFVLIRKEEWEGEQLPPTGSDNSSGYQQWLQKNLLWERGPVPQPTSTAIRNMKYPATAVTTVTSAPPIPREATPRVPGSSPT